MQGESSFVRRGRIWGRKLARKKSKFGQSPKPLKIYRVPWEPLSLLRCFDDLGDILETRICKEISERIQPQPAFPDMLVSVDSTGQSSLRVVEMECLDPSQTPRFKGLLDPARVDFGTSQVVSCGEGVTRVQAEADSRRGQRGRAEDLYQFPDLPGDLVALSRGVLQEEGDGHRRCLLQDPGQGFGRSMDAFITPGSFVRAGMHDEEGDPQGFASFQVLQDHSLRHAPDLGVGGGQIDEIRGVGQSTTDPGFQHSLPEGAGLFRRNRFGGPSARVPGEDLQDIATELRSPSRGKWNPSRDGEMGAEEEGGHVNLWIGSPRRPSWIPWPAAPANVVGPV